MLNYSSVAITIYKINNYYNKISMCNHKGIISYVCCPNLLFDLGNNKNDLEKMSQPFCYLLTSLVK